MKRLIIFLLLFLSCGIAQAQFKFTAKIRILKPVEISLQDLNGNTIFSGTLKPGQPFEFTSPTFVKDYYKLNLGDFEMNILLDDSPVILKGFLADGTKNTTNIVVEGTPQNELLKEADYLFKNSDRKIGWSWDAVNGKYEPVVLAALIYDNYDFFRLRHPALKELIEQSAGDKDLQQSLLVTFIYDMLKKTEHFVEGNYVKDFSLQDKEGNIFNLSHFKGKYVLLDFWASWCGGCISEMHTLKPIYNEIKRDNLEFISISLDDNKEKWITALKKIDIPWLSLWDSDGFKKSTFKDQFGFNQIPFIALISPEGRILSRKIRGEEVKNEILKHIK